MNVLQIVGDSKFGGGAILIARFAEAAMKRGWTADILTTDPQFQEALKKRGVGIVDLDVIWRPIRPLRDYLGGRRLARFLRQSNYDLVHTHTSKAGVVGRWAAHKARIKGIIHTVHGFAFHEQSSWSTIRAYGMLERMAGKWCHKIVTVSEFHRDWAVELGIGDANKIVAIANGISPDRVEPSKSAAIVRGELGIQSDELLILSMGRLAREKGLEYLLEAAALLKEKFCCPYRVVLAGDGPLRSHLESMTERLGIQQRVEFLGFREDVGNLLVASDIVVLPSLREGLSIALLEAMAAGKPIVATTIGSNREVTRNGKDAVLVPPGDSQALADAICRLAACENESRQIAENGNRRYQENYTETRMLDAYMDLYGQLTSQ